MAEPRPLHALLLLEGVGLAALAAWWAMQPAPWRYQQLLAVMTAEQGASRPPTPLMAQAEWLMRHRWMALQSLMVLAGVALVIGGVEGMAGRSRDMLGGFRFSWWACGCMGGGVLIGLAAAYLVLPWPLRLLWVASGAAVLVGGMGFALGFGRPYQK